MCGIIGLWLNDGVSEDKLAAMLQGMTQTLIHRGPDDEGFWLDPEVGIGFGQRRLSIQDTSPAGHQPMISSNGEWIIVYNGETYSHRELIPLLQQKGITLRGHSDTEVMLESIATLGLKETIQHLIGMFALALWNRREKKLYLICDRVGIKPLYWAKLPNGIAFASELKAFRALPNFSCELNTQAEAVYFRFGYIPAPLSIYKQAHKLEPGTIVTFDSMTSMEQEAYWSLHNIVHQPIRSFPSEQAATDELEDLLSDAVGRRLLSDVPLGAFLSGGVDSSLVVALMQKQTQRPVKTFTIGFAENDYNEAPYAQAVAQFLKTDHTELYMSSRQAMNVIPNLAGMYDEPFADPSQIPTYLVSSLARGQVTVALSGDGGDELFAGYNRYHWTNKIWNYSQYLPFRSRVSEKILQTPTQKWHTLQKFLPFLPARFGERLQRLASLLNKESPQAIYRALLTPGLSPDEIGLTEDDFPASYQEVLGDPLSTFQFIDMLTYLPGDILTKLDRASMAVSLETRVPLLDHRVVGWAWQLPLSLKARRGKGKYLLKKVLYRHVPRRLIERPKMGFGVPIDAWLRGPLKEWAEDLIFDPTLTETVDSRLIQKYWERHTTGQQNHQYLLWIILMFQEWRRRWKV